MRTAALKDGIEKSAVRPCRPFKAAGRRLKGGQGFRLRIREVVSFSRVNVDAFVSDRRRPTPLSTYKGRSSSHGLLYCNCFSLQSLSRGY